MQRVYMTKDWYPEYIKKYESMKKRHTRLIEKWTEDMNSYFTEEERFYIWKKTPLNFISNQRNAN